jgi:secondary thiamine-phosphate synthase enzyme
MNLKFLDVATFQETLILPEMPRGYHLITSQIEAALPHLRTIQGGILNVFIQHTSASLTINENADPSVRVDLEDYFNRVVPEDDANYTHNYEGSDDMPAHIKTSQLDVSLNIPVSNGRLALGTWQGIYLCEHRNSGGRRKLILTLQGA